LYYHVMYMLKLSLVVIGLFMVFAVLCTGCTEQPATLMDSQIVIEDKGEYTMDLDPGKYRVTLQSDEPIDVSFSTVSSYDKSEVTQYDTVVTLSNPAVLKVKNPSLFGMGPNANVMMRVIKNPV